MAQEEGGLTGASPGSLGERPKVPRDALNPLEWCDPGWTAQGSDLMGAASQEKRVQSRGLWQLAGMASPRKRTGHPSGGSKKGRKRAVGSWKMEEDMTGLAQLCYCYTYELCYT